jgi:hypothetical protein
MFFSPSLLKIISDDDRDGDDGDVHDPKNEDRDAKILSEPQ